MTQTPRQLSIGLLLGIGLNGCAQHIQTDQPPVIDTTLQDMSNKEVFPQSISPSPPFAPALPPGERQSGQHIAIPHMVKAGKPFNGAVPVGSHLTIEGQAIELDTAGYFSWSVPSSTRGTLTLILHRPGRSAPMRFKVTIIE